MLWRAARALRPARVSSAGLLEAYLDGLDCEIAVAVDGRDTLTKVAEFQPDLILLDIMMPKLSGFEVCKTLKRDVNTRQIMILMVTALGEAGDILVIKAGEIHSFRNTGDSPLVQVDVHLSPRFIQENL